MQTASSDGPRTRAGARFGTMPAMTMPAPPPALPQSRPQPRPVRPSRAPGWLLTAPALVLWLFGLVLPVLSTGYLSLTAASVFPGGGRFVGAENYVRLLRDDTWWRALAFTLVVAVVRVAAVAVVPPLLAWGTAAVGRRAAIPLSVVFAVPLTFATPVFAAIAARFHAQPGTFGGTLAARIGVLGFDGTYALLYGCGLGLVVLVAALRAETRPGRTGLLGGPFLLAWGVGLLAAAAYGLQSFTGATVLTAGGPDRVTTTVGLFTLLEGLSNGRMGYAAAGCFIFLVPLLVLGTAAGLLVVLTRAALEPVPAAAAPRRTAARVPALVVGAIALLVALVVWGRGLWPVVAGWSGRPVEGIRVGGVLGRLFLHDLPTTLLVVAVALAAAFGIVVFRPLGRASEWLLLPFAPWLFVTSVATGPALFLAYTHGTVQRPFAHLQPALGLLPILLFAFVLLLRGLAPRWQVARARREPRPFGRHVLAPGWLAALGVSAGAFVAVAHDLVTPYVTVVDASAQPLPLAMTRVVAQFAVARDTAVTRPDLPLAFVGFAVIAVAVAWYAGRLVLRTSRS